MPGERPSALLARENPEIIRSILQYLYAHPPAAETLRRALEYQAQGHEGFRWQHVRVMPKALTQLVLDGLIDRLDTPGAWYSVTHPLEAMQAVNRFFQEQEDIRRQRDSARNSDLPPLPVGVPPTLFDSVLGYADVKRQLFLALGTATPTHVLLYGKPGTGKTLFMEAIGRLPGAVFRHADTVTKSGLRRVVTQERPRYLILDELDKMSYEQDTILLELMDGIVSAMNYNESYSEAIDMRVFAAANEIRHLRPELRSRFLKIPIRDYSPEEFVDIATGYLVKNGIAPRIATMVAIGVSHKSRDLREAIRIARMARSEEDAEFLIRTLGQDARV
jgi:sulfur transfer complex TusBCD TusB component (DsrH family)